MSQLYLDDLQFARQCSAGDEAAWERFVRDYRPLLYKAADALDPSGGARDLVDSLYGDLYGAECREGTRRSLLTYYHGRSSLATWLRAVLARRYVDRLRSTRRLASLPEEDNLDGTAAAAPAVPPDPDRSRLTHLAHEALSRAIARLSDRDRLRLGCYYVQQLTLAETGRVLTEHEATVSRHLARTRRAIRAEVEQYLRDAGRLTPDQIAESLASVTEDPGTLDLEAILGARKESSADRSVR